MNRALAITSLLLVAFLGWEAWAIKDFAAKDTRPPSWDEAVQLEIALDCHNAVHAGRWKDVFFIPAKPGMPPFPPLYHVAAMFAYDLSPDNPAGAALWLNWVYLAIFCLSLFAVAWTLDLAENAWVAAVALSAAPVVLHMTHVRLLDLGVAAWVAACYAAYLRSDRFFRWPSSLLFGVLFAAGMMHKWSFFSYLLPIYFEAFAAMRYPETRLQTVAAAAIALIGFAPWYASHAPLLIPRLFQASSDFAVPVWEHGAFAFYFLQLPAALGPVLFALVCVGLFFPLRTRRGRDSKLMHAWFLASYVFWAIVPNRQIRFLVPGLGGLSLLACGPWPVEMLAAVAAFQVFTAANFTQAWFPTWTFGPNNRIVLLPTDPPVREDWHILDILKTAQAKSPSEVPFSNVTLVANHERFNGPNFTWTAKWRRFDRVRMRGVNRRLCEFSRFVVLKSGDLGPPSVTEGLPEAAKLIENPKSWFASAYEPVGRWLLPDKSVAMLFELKSLPRAPFAKSRYDFAKFAVAPFSANDLSVDLGTWSRTQSSYDRSTASAESAELRGLEVRKLAVEMDGLELVPAGAHPKADPWKDVRFLKLGALKIDSLEIDAGSLRKFLEARVPGLKLSEVRLEGDIDAAGNLKGWPVEAAISLRIEREPNRLIVRLGRTKIDGFSIPLFLLGRYREIDVPLDANPETPFSIDVPSLTIARGKLTIP